MKLHFKGMSKVADRVSKKTSNSVVKNAAVVNLIRRNDLLKIDRSKAMLLDDRTMKERITRSCSLRMKIGF